MLNVTPIESAEIKDLYMRVESVGATGLKPKDIIDFVRLRKCIFKLSMTRRSEFEIIKLLSCRMAGKLTPYSPRLFIEFDYDELNPVEKRDLQNSLRNYFSDLTKDGDISFNALNAKANDLMPARNAADLSYGIEALYSVLMVSEGKNKMKVFKGPNQSGEIDDDNVE